MPRPIIDDRSELCITVACRLARHELAADEVFATGEFTSSEESLIFETMRYELRRQRDEVQRIGPAQRKAAKLLRLLLDETQLQDLRRWRYFFEVGSATGARYRLNPKWGEVCKPERHGRREYGITRYCIHDPERVLPPADLTIAHLCLLRADEPAFLAIAHESRYLPTMWDGEWRQQRAALARQLRQYPTASKLELFLDGIPLAPRPALPGPVPGRPIPDPRSVIRRAML